MIKRVKGAHKPHNAQEGEKVAKYSDRVSSCATPTQTLRTPLHTTKGYTYLLMDEK